MIGAVLIIEATGLGGPTLPLVLLPGLLAAGRRLARLHRAGVVLGLQHRRLVAEPVPAAAVRRAGLGRLRLDDPARRRHRRRRVRDHGARPLGEAARRPAPVPAHDRGRTRRRRARDRLRRSDRRIARRGALLGPGGVRHALRRRRRPSRSRRSRCCSCSRGSRGRSRSETSAAARPSRRSSSASSPA